MEKADILFNDLDNDRTSTGTDIKSYLTVAESFDVDAVGVNCGDPKLLIKIVEKMCKNTNKPVLVYPNAGIPKLLNGKQFSMSSQEEWFPYAKNLLHLVPTLLADVAALRLYT